MVGTLASTQDVLDRIGIHANATIAASTQIIARYIGLAEQVVCTETRVDWITGFSRVISPVKEELKSCVASHAAKQIIMYDMSGFSTRAEAITMLNVNQDEFVRTIKALKDLDTNKIRSVPV
jgi:hypothetical protein